MKKLITLMLAVCLVFAMVGIYASAETLDGVEDLATYTVPDSTKYGQSWYIDAEGEYKLFDGVIPDTNTLDAARDEAMKRRPGYQRLVCLGRLDCAGQIDCRRCL